MNAGAGGSMDAKFKRAQIFQKTLFAPIKKIVWETGLTQRSEKQRKTLISRQSDWEPRQEETCQRASDQLAQEAHQGSHQGHPAGPNCFQNIWYFVPPPSCEFPGFCQLVPQPEAEKNGSLTFLLLIYQFSSCYSLLYNCEGTRL